MERIEKKKLIIKSTIFEERKKIYTHLYIYKTTTTTKTTTTRAEIRVATSLKTSVPLPIHGDGLTDCTHGASQE